MSQDPVARRLRGRPPRILVSAIAVTVVVSGVVVAWRALALQSRASYGWFAYAPLSDTTFATSRTPSIALWVGISLVAAGLVTLAFLLGRRRARIGEQGARPVGRRILGSAPALAAAAVLVAAGVALVHWQLTHLLMGWRNLLAGGDGLTIVATKEQFDVFSGPDAMGPLLVGTVLGLLGLAALAFVVGRLSARPSRP